MQRRKFNLQECLSEAKKYSTRTSLLRGSGWAYHALLSRGLLDDACAHMQISPVYVKPKWTHQSVFDEAAKYQSRAEFKRCAGGAHGYAIQHRIIEPACAHMRDGANFWHIFELMAVALKYSRKSDFIVLERSAYQYCNTHKLTDLICAHMEQGTRWTKESVLAAARQCQSRSEFHSRHPGAYKHMDKHGYADEAFAHMEVLKRPMCKDMAMESAKRFETRSAFQLNDGGAYVFAQKNGFIDEACAHMEPGATGFDGAKPGVLYHLRIDAPGVGPLFKVGITNRDPVRRVAGMGLFPGVTASVLSTINFQSGRDARIREKQLHKQFSCHRYTGCPVMKNGNTELFTVPVI